jgi:proteic killer suppression protein
MRLPFGASMMMSSPPATGFIIAASAAGHNESCVPQPTTDLFESANHLAMRRSIPERDVFAPLRQTNFVDDIRCGLADTCPVPHTDVMIKSFADKPTEAFFTNGTCPAQWRSLAKVAARKLDTVDAAVQLADLRAPPGNRLEALKGDQKAQHSIRINDQRRICFRWTDDGPEDVAIVDYH